LSQLSELRILTEASLDSFAVGPVNTSTSLRPTRPTPPCSGPPSAAARGTAAD